MTEKLRKYDADDITGFRRDLEKIRAKPTLFIGPTDGAGIFTILREPVDNGTDEARAGRNNFIGITIEGPQGPFTVYDAGVGIPVTVHKKMGINTLTHVVSNLQSSGKMKVDGAYKSAVGCFTGDTEIRLLSGKTLTMEQIYHRWTKNEKDIPVMSYNLKEKRLEPSVISFAQIAKTTRHIAHVHLDDGSVIKCTYDHPFYVNRGGSIKKIEAENLRQDDSLVSTYYGEDRDGYLTQTQDGAPKLVHRLVGHFYNSVTPGIEEVHHRNENKRDNRPGNLEILTKADHQREHSESRSIFGREKIMETQAGLRKRNSRAFSKQNTDPDFIEASQKAKFVRVASRVVARELPLTGESYEKVRCANEPSWKRAKRYFSSPDILWSRAKDHVSTLESRVGISSNAEDSLFDLKFKVGLTPKDASQQKNWIKSIKVWSEALLVCPSPEDATPQEFNRRSKSTAVVFGRYAQLSRYTSLKKLKLHVLHGQALELFEDQSQEAQDRRMYRAEAKLRTPESLRKMVATFVASARRVKGPLTEKAYTRVKASCAPQWAFALAILDFLHGEVDVEDFVAKFNHRVVRVLLKKYTNAVPVYDVTVDNTHTFFVNPGVLVSNTHGVGLKATNALSTTFEVWTFRKESGGWHYTKFEKGVEKVEVKRVKAPPLKVEKGTIIRFTPDPKIFGKHKLNVKDVVQWATMTSYMNPGLKIQLTAAGKTKVWVSKDGIKAYLKDRVTTLKAEMFSKKVITHTSSSLEMALAFTDLEGPNVEFFTNTVRNVEEGVHADDVYRALFDSLKPFVKLKKAKGGKGKDNKFPFTPSDLRDGLLGVVNYKIDAPQFDSQTKEKLVDQRVKGACYDESFKVFATFWKENGKLAKDLVARASELRSKTADFLKDKKLVKTVKGLAKGINAKLAGIVGNAPLEKRELLLVEGDSAGGGLKRARNRSFQAVFPLKGKPLNVAEAAADKVSANKEAMGILAALGVQLDGKNAGSIKYGKVICFADADADGSHINTLMLALFHKYTPHLFKNGNIYVIKSPLYKCTYKDKVYFGMTKDEIYEQLGTQKCDISYLKGWGEVDEDDLKTVALDPKTRQLYRVVPSDKKGSLDFELLMGKKPEYRKKLLGVN